MMSKWVKSIIWMVIFSLLTAQPLFSAVAAGSKNKLEAEFVTSVEAWEENGIVRVQAQVDQKYDQLGVVVTAGDWTDSFIFKKTNKLSLRLSGHFENSFLIQLKGINHDELEQTALVRVNMNQERENSESEYSELSIEKSEWERMSSESTQLEVNLLFDDSVEPQDDVKKRATQYERKWQKQKKNTDSLAEPASYNDRYEVEPNHSMEKADWMSAGFNAYGRIAEKGDSDYWKVKFPDTGTMSLWLGEMPGKTNYDLYVYDEKGNELKRSENRSTMDEWIEGIGGEKGQFLYMLVKSNDNSFDKSKYYRLKATFTADGANIKADEYEPNNDFNNATSIQSGQNIIATMHTLKDVDYYKLNVDLSSTIYIDLTDISEEMDLDLYVYDSTKKQVAQSLNGKNKSESITYNGNAGTYYVKVAVDRKSKLKDKPYKLTMRANTMPVILIPGVGGSQLVDGNDLIWVGAQEVAWNDYLVTYLSLIPISPGSTEVKPKYNYSVTPNMANHGIQGISMLTGFDFEGGYQYKHLIEDLESKGYKIGRTLFGLPYDWRIDLRKHHDYLNQQITSALIESGAQKVQLVAHSMGGLLIKDYLLMDQKRAYQVHNIVTVGTPYLGAATASKALLLGYNFGIIFMPPITGYKIAENAPAVYQIAPNEEYNRQMMLRYKRSTFGYFDRYRKYHDLPLSSLKQTYPNQDLMKLAQIRSSFWENKYPTVSQYHIVGDSQSTIIGINRWGETSFEDPNTTIEFVVGLGDGTVPLFSAENPGSKKAKVYYAKTEGHLEILRETHVRQQILRFLDGNPKEVKGIQRTPHVSKQGTLTAYSLTGKKEHFRDLKIIISDENQGEQEKLEFTQEGNLNRLGLTKKYLIEEMELDDEYYNVQIFVDSKSKTVLSLDSDKLNEFSLASYETKETGTQKQKMFERPNNKNITKITIIHNKENRKAYTDKQELKSYWIGKENIND